MTIRPGTFMYAYTKHPIEEPKHLELAKAYEPKMPPDWPRMVKDRVQRVKKAVGQDGIVGTWSPHGPFNNCSLLIDLNTLYSMFLTDPEYYRELITFAYERSLPYAQALDEVKVDVHCVGAATSPAAFSGNRPMTPTYYRTRKSTSISYRRTAPRRCTTTAGTSWRSWNPTKTSK